MIAKFLAVDRLQATEHVPERFQIAFLDSEERAWTVWMPVNPTTRDLAQALNIAACLASEPDRAVQLGLITQEMYDGATEIRNRNRLMHGPTPERSM